MTAAAKKTKLTKETPGNGKPPGKEKPSAAAREVITSLVSDTAKGQMVDLSLIDWSDTPYQIYRRKDFTDKNIAEFAETLRQGLLHPVLLRPKGKRFEMVLGERRDRGHRYLGLKQIRAEIREMTDLEVSEAQITENKDRLAPDPMGEAIAYQDLMKKGMTAEDIHLRTGRSVKFILETEKLLNLIEPLQKLLREERLPLGHARMVAKLPADTQKLLMQRGNHGLLDWSNDVVSLAELKDRLNKYVYLKLANAPFPLERDDLGNVPCPECPQRTGAAPGLFGGEVNEGDRCLNPTCFQTKVETFVKITRTEISAPLQGQKGKGYKAPVVSRDSYTNAKLDGESLLTAGNYVKIGGANKECDSTEPAIIGEGKELATTIHICRDRKCKIHYGKSSSVSSRGGSASDSKKRGIQREQKLDAAVSEVVRVKILTAIAAKFDAKHPFIKVSEYSDRGLDRFWQTGHGDYHTQSVFRRILFGEPGKNDSAAKDDVLGEASRYGFKKAWGTEKLDEDQKQKLWFLLVFGFQSPQTIGSVYKPQDTVRYLAEKYEIDWVQLDAEERFLQLPKKYKVEYQSYLDAVRTSARTDTRPPVPRFYSTDYTPAARCPDDENPTFAPWEKPKEPVKAKAKKAPVKKPAAKKKPTAKKKTAAKAKK